MSLLSAGVDSWHAYQETYRRVRHGDFEHANSEERTSAAVQLIRMTSAAAAVSTMQPLPFVDVVPLTALQRRPSDGASMDRFAASSKPFVRRSAERQHLWHAGCPRPAP